MCEYNERDVKPKLKYGNGNEFIDRYSELTNKMATDKFTRYKCIVASDDCQYSLQFKQSLYQGRSESRDRYCLINQVHTIGPIPIILDIF
jgi:hypothetical protein